MKARDRRRAARKERLARGAAAAASERDRPDSLAPTAEDVQHESFFVNADDAARGGEPGHDAVDLDAELHRDPMLEMKMRPEVRARRARLTRYVQLTVGALATLFAVGLVRQGLAHRDPRTVTAAAAAPMPAAPVAFAAPSVTTLAVASPPPDIQPRIEVPLVPPEPPPAAPEKSAKEEKLDARKALEHGAVKKAIAAGERATDLDPADAESWLILGAAYMSAGKKVEARACFASCVKEGKRGPVRECRAMLR